MSAQTTIARIFALLAVMGLILGPIARPAMAMPSVTHASMDENTAMHPMGAAPDDMPCCPGKPSLPDCDNDCPFMASCGAIVLHSASQAGLIIPFTLLAIVLPGDASALASLAHAPPRKPPKS